MRQCPSCGGFCKKSGCERANVPKVALPCCGYTDAGAIKWNPYNQVVQCHNCGQVYTAPAQRTPLTDEQQAQPSCDECGKKKSDGWALYCVACMEKANQAQPVAYIGTNGELAWLKKPEALYSKPVPLYMAPPTDESLLNKLRVAEETLERCKEVARATAECYRMDMERNAALIRQLVEALGLVMERIDRDIEPNHSWACFEREMAVRALAAAEAHGIGGRE